jgi:hypothetical protein
MNTYANRGYQGNPEYQPYGMPEEEEDFDLNDEWHEEEFDENVSHASSRAAQTIVDSQRSTRLKKVIGNQQVQKERDIAPRATSPGIKRATNQDFREFSQGEGYEDIQGAYEEDDYLVVGHEIIVEEQEDNDPEQKKDFGSAYDQLVERMHFEQGNNLLLNQDELEKAMEKKELRKHLKQRADHRIKDFQENKRRKMEIIKQENSNKELEECTFKPRMMTKPAARRRNLDEFLEDQRKHEEDKAIKRNILLEQESQVEAGVIYHPEINESSRKMLAKRNQDEQPVYERLYGISKKNKKLDQILNDATSSSNGQSDESHQRYVHGKPQKVEVNNDTFAPKINAKSRDIVRDQPVQELLYNDALRRKDMNELKKQKIIKESAKKKTQINESNIEYLIHRFNKEFEPTFETVAQQGDEGVTEILNYRQLGELLFDMGFLSGSASSESEERILLSSMWTGLGGAQNEGLHKEVIRAFLLAVEGVKITDSVKAPSEEEFGQMKDGEFYPDCSKISKNFKLMYLNRIRHSRDGTKKKLMKIESDAFHENTFQPILSENTRNLANKYRQKIADNYEGGKITVLDILTAQTNKEQWIEETKKELENKEQEECTFHPMTNENFVIKADESIVTTGDKCFDLYQLGQNKKKEKIDKSREEYEFEKNVTECTFQPNLAKNREEEVEKPHYINQRSIQDNLDRMKRAREERDFKKRMTERGFDANANDKDKSPNQPAKKIIKKRPTNYTRPQVKKPVKAISVATTGSRTAKREETKSYGAKQNSKRRTAADRSRVIKPTQSSQRKVNTKPAPKQKEVRVIEHARYSDPEEQDEMDAEQMYRHIEDEEDEIHEKIAYAESPESHQPIEQYIEDANEDPNEDPNEYPAEYQQDYQDHEESPEGEQPEYEGQEGELDNEGEGNPLLFVDVNLGPGRAERIVVYEGDTAEELAEEFTLKHGLDESLKEKLVKLLENQIAGLLGTINEGDEATSNGTDNQ